MRKREREVEVGRVEAVWCFFLKGIYLIGPGPHPHDLIDLPKTPTLNIIILGVKASIYEFGGGHKHSVHNIQISMLSFLIVVIIQGLCKEMSLFLGNIT